MRDQSTKLEYDPSVSTDQGRKVKLEEGGGQRGPFRDYYPQTGYRTGRGTYAWIGGKTPTDEKQQRLSGEEM